MLKFQASSVKTLRSPAESRRWRQIAGLRCGKETAAGIPNGAVVQFRKDGDVGANPSIVSRRLNRDRGIAQ